MPYVNISEIDNTQYGLSSTSNTNVVYCPLNSTCGTYEATLIESYDDFIREYGNSGCTNDRSYDYVKDIILSGFPVLCKRIEYADIKADATEKEGCATVTDDAYGLTIYANNHGTYLNECYVEKYCRVEEKAVSGQSKKLSRWVVTISLHSKNGALLESAVFYGDYGTDAKDENKPTSGFTKINSEINNYEFKYIQITIDSTHIDGLIGGSVVKAWTLKSGKDIDTVTTPIDIAVLKTFDSSSANEGKFNKYLGFLNDKYLWEVKFITTGGYALPSGGSTAVEQAAFNGMVSICDPDFGGRGDCMAILDIGKDVEASSVKQHFTNVDTTYAAAYAPWNYVKLRNGSKEWMPPSYAFLTNLASSVSSGTPIYYPPAGVNRMKCRRTIKTEYEIGANILNSWQPKTNDSQFINPIMNIRGAGYAVYGQRTLVNLVAPVMQTSLKSVTVRLCAIEIKKAIFNAAIQLTFEQNILRTWNEFKTRVGTKLFEMKKNGGINSYIITMDRSTISESDLNNNIARGNVRCAINDALENFEIGFEISPSYVNFDDEQETIDISKDIDALN